MISSTLGQPSMLRRNNGPPRDHFPLEELTVRSPAKFAS
jgi:hypothetical protein